MGVLCALCQSHLPPPFFFARRALRIINAQENVTYVEYDHKFMFNTSDPTGAGLQW